MKKLLLFLLVLTFLLSACTPTRESKEKTESEIQAEIENEEKPTELTVYGVGDQVVQVDREENKTYNYYITMYEMGPYGPLTNASRESGYMFYDAIQEFENKTGIKINLQLFNGMEAIDKQIEEDKKEGKGPDILLIDMAGWAGASSHNNIYRLMFNNELVDTMAYLEMDQVYTSGEYYNKVLEAGILNEKQYVLPLCFNMNGLFTSVEDMNALGVIIEQQMSSGELLNQLQQACTMAEEGELILDNLSSWTVPTTFVQDFWESTGCPVVNYETGEVTVNRQLFEDVAECFKEYMRMNIVEDWDSVLNKAEEYLNDPWWQGYITPGNLETLDENRGRFMKGSDVGLEWMDQGVFYYENSIATGGSHTIMGQCATLNTIYDALNEEMVMVGMPMYEKNDQYVAQVQHYGGISASTKYPYHCYQVLKFLMDQEYSPYYVIPVKKANAEVMIDQLSNTTYTLHLGLSAGWEENQDFTTDTDPYTIQPLPENMTQQLQHMLDNIGGSVLPQASIYVPLLWHMEAYTFELETMDEAYENACADLEEHLEYIMAGNSGRTLYEGGYDNFLLRGEDLRMNKN